MIQIYDIGNENYDRNGNAVLTPTAGRVTMQAGGACDISLTLPMDPEGKWRHVVPGAVVKAPVPREVIENSFSGYAADIYKTVGAADLREDKVAPTRISYPQWNAMDMTYTVGSRVSCYGWPHQNYECTYFDNSSPITQVPPYNSAWWKPIADYTPGAAVVVSLPAGSELYWIENAGSGWFKMSTYYGLEGYIQTSAVVFDRHVSETENQPRIITEQLFRLREPSNNNETRTVTVTGQHVSYDLAGILCKNITITQASPAMAMGRVVENMMMDYRGTIATNLTSEENGTYTGKTNGKNGMFMLLDPDAGIVHAFNAKFTRDNWDVFVMKKTSALSGYRISYAKNMRGVTWKKSSAGLVTRVVPVAKNTDGEDLYLPEKWVDSAHIAEYPVILMELLRISAQVGRDDGTGTDTVWTESALYDYMREKAGERFSVDHVDEVVDDLTVQFEQLGDTAEYERIRPLESVLLYDNIVCQDRDIGLEKVLTVTELEWDPIRRKVTGIRLSNITGAAGRTVTGFNVQNNSITPAKLTEEVTQEIVGQVQALIPDYTDPEAGKYTLPPASSTALGGIKTGFQASGKNYPVALDANYKAYVYVPWDPGSYTLPLAQDGVRGGIQIGFTASGKNYPVALDGEKAYVYVPWTADGGNAATVNGHSVNTDVPAGAVFTDHYDWDDITNKPATATRWPTWAEVTGKPNRAGSSSDGGAATSALTLLTNNTAQYADDCYDGNPGLHFYRYNGSSGQGGGDGFIMQWSWNAGSVGQQLYMDDNPSGILMIRGYNSSDQTFTAWRQLVLGDGTGASGTWGISVTGSAGSVPWSGVSDKPDTATRWPAWSEVTGKPNRAGSDSDGGDANNSVLLGSYFYHKRVIAIPSAQTYAAGWRRVCKVSPRVNYLAFFISPNGGYNNIAPSEALVRVQTRHASAKMTLLSNFDTNGQIKRIRLVSISGNTFWVDVYMNASSVINTDQYLHFYGNVSISDIQNSSAVYTESVTAAEEISLESSSVAGICVTDRNYSNWLPSKTGTGASGTWGINVTGSAGSVAWANVSDKPATATRWPTWSEVTSKPTEFTPADGSGYYTLDKGNVTSIGSGSPASGAKTFFEENCTNLRVTTAYNNRGEEYTIIFGRGGNSNFGNILKMGYVDRYLRLLRRRNGSWLSDDWEKIYAGYADSAGSATNADTVDSFHGVDLLTEVDSQKHRLQIRTGSGNLANNTDTYIPFSTPFSTLCAAVVPVSTSGFNAPNALSIVSNNKNGVTVKQNNAMGVSMNVIVVAFGY